MIPEITIVYLLLYINISVELVSNKRILKSWCFVTKIFNCSKDTIWRITLHDISSVQYTYIYLYVAYIDSSISEFSSLPYYCIYLLQKRNAPSTSRTNFNKFHSTIIQGTISVMLSRAWLTLNVNSKRPVHINLRITRQCRVRLEYRPRNEFPFVLRLWQKLKSVLTNA